MTIQPHTLRATIELTLGCRPDPTLIEDLARTLEAPDEILPWLILRQTLFANDPAALAQLHALAACAKRPTPTRPNSTPIAPEAQGLDRRLEECLHELIATEAARTGLTAEIGSLLHHDNVAHPAREFRRHISELACE